MAFRAVPGLAETVLSRNGFRQMAGITFLAVGMALAEPVLVAICANHAALDIGVMVQVAALVRIVLGFYHDACTVLPCASRRRTGTLIRILGRYNQGLVTDIAYACRRTVGIGITALGLACKYDPCHFPRDWYPEFTVCLRSDFIMDHKDVVVSVRVMAVPAELAALPYTFRMAAVRR